MKKLLCLLVLLGCLSGGVLRAVSMITADQEHDEDYYSMEDEEDMEEHDEGFDED